MKDKLDYLIEQWRKPIPEPDDTYFHNLIRDTVSMLRNPKRPNQAFVFEMEAIYEIQKQIDIEWTEIQKGIYMIERKNQNGKNARSTKKKNRR